MDGTGEITVSARSEADFVCIDVIDSGGGISPDYLEKIFTPFSTTKQNGTGLGLIQDLMMAVPFLFISLCSSGNLCKFKYSI